MSSLMPLTRLQHLSSTIAALLVPEGQEVMLRQTRLLSLRALSMFSDGASDGLLQVISRLSHLTRLEWDLQAEHILLAEVQLPFQLEPATDNGVQCLSSLRTLQHLTLTVNKHYSLVTRSGSQLHWDPAPADKFVPEGVAHGGHRPGSPDTPAAPLTTSVSV